MEQNKQEQPAGEASTVETLLPRVQQVINEVRPTLQADGGDIELLGIIPELKARVRLVGACKGCPSASITLSFGVEKYLRERIPEIQGLVLDK
jgi:Fe-S cluster biogenesis protein NfuA